MILQVNQSSSEADANDKLDNHNFSNLPEETRKKSVTVFPCDWKMGFNLAVGSLDDLKEQGVTHVQFCCLLFM